MDLYTADNEAAVRGVGLIDLIVALLIISLTAIGLLESRHRAFEALRSASETLSRSLEAPPSSIDRGARCRSESDILVCDGDSIDRSVIFIGP